MIRVEIEARVKENILNLFPRLQKEAVAREVQLRVANECLQKAFEQSCATPKSVSKVKLDVANVILRVLHLSNAMQNKIHKFYHVYEGPYKITRTSDSNAFELSIP